jgi:hypothetical protein
MSGEANGRVKLAIRDIVAWLVLFAAILGNWYDTRGQIALLRQELALRVEQSKAESVRVWKAIDDVGAAERPKPLR